MPRVGVLALQGDVREHSAALVAVGAEAVLVRHPRELDGLDGLILPGGESTAIAHLLETSGLRVPLERELAAGTPVLGTCAGLILLADRVLDGRTDQWSYRRLLVAVRRNGFGRQVASFESPVRLGDGHVITGVFIRAPRIEDVGPEVQVLATLERDGAEVPVLVRQGATWGCAFHPELTTDRTIHERFVAALMCSSATAR